MQARLTAIWQYYKSVTVTVIIKADWVASTSTYGEPSHPMVEITTRGLVSNVGNIRNWEGRGMMPSGLLRLSIWSLSSGGTNYLTSEYFNDDRSDNITVKIGDVYYKPESIAAPESIIGSTPYWVMYLTKLETAVQP